MKVAILADIHANSYALNAVLADCEEEQVDHFIVAGDLIGYYYWPRPVVRCLMSDSRFTCIRGNHEDILAQSIDSDAVAERYRQRYGSGYDVCRKTLSSNEMKWLLNLPSCVELTLGGAHFAVYHGSPASTDEYIYPNAPVADLVRCHVGRDFTVLAHTHYPFIHHMNGRVLLNPGSVGQPRDFGGQASYALINVANRTVRFKRVPFDVNVVIAAARASDPTLDYLQKIMSRKVL